MPFTHRPPAWCPHKNQYPRLILSLKIRNACHPASLNVGSEAARMARRLLVALGVAGLLLAVSGFINAPGELSAVPRGAHGGPGCPALEGVPRRSHALHFLQSQELIATDPAGAAAVEAAAAAAATVAEVASPGSAASRAAWRRPSTTPASPAAAASSRRCSTPAAAGC